MIKKDDCAKKYLIVAVFCLLLCNILKISDMNIIFKRESGICNNNDSQLIVLRYSKCKKKILILACNS